MPTLTTLILGSLTIEVDYIVEAGEPMIKYGPNAGPGCDAELHIGAITAVIGDAGEELELDDIGVWCGLKNSIPKYDSMLGMLEEKCWEHYAKYCKDNQEADNERK